MTEGQIRRLRSKTIVSDDLYVVRHADRQLSDVIEGMGRPGYVLVARQMGKTNLLLHMKRRLEEAGDIVIYVDLSQKFESARACFRYIIDLAIEMRPDAFGKLSEEISRDRLASTLDPSLEYTRHLRMLVRAMPSERLVIVLDEIDSLVHAAHSDTIMAHVRSTYFVRTNYVEFDRLTYVLSGVAEPADLIKDKNISPFNIGEKIYLNDFSREEFDRFVENSRLLLSAEIIDRVYWWSRGNPRITWDILASIEEAALAGGVLSIIDVDKLVDRLYLESFNRPPVDHIRTLVENDASLRIALMAIRYAKSATVDERARSKLYLAGIIGDPGREPVIRNPVIDAALSEEWLKKLEANNSDPLALGNEHYAGRRYKLAKESFEKAKQSGLQFTPSQGVIYGLSLYNLALYAEVVETLEPLIERVRGEMRTTAEYHLGSSYILIGRPDDAIPVLSRAADEGAGAYRFPSEILRAAANYQRGEDVVDSLRVSSKARIIEVAGEESVGGELGDATVVPSLIYSVGYSALGAGFNQDASEYLDSALSMSPPGLLPAILITKFAIAEDETLRKRLAIDASNAIMDNQLHPVNDDVAAAAYTERGLFAVIIALIEVGEFEQVKKLADFVVNNERVNSSAVVYVSELATRLGEASQIGHDSVRKLISFFGKHANSLEEKIAIQRSFIIYAADRDKLNHVKQYANIALALNASVSDEDLSIILIALQNAMASNMYQDIIEVTSSLIKVGTENVSVWLLLVWFYRMTAERQLFGLREARFSAGKIVELSKGLPTDSPLDVGRFIDSIVSQAHKMVEQEEEPSVQSLEKIGRNQKVFVRDLKSGMLKTVKFKLVEHRIRIGELELVSVVNN